MQRLSGTPWILALAVLSACTSPLPAGNPFDPETPREKQARAALHGRVVLLERGATAAGVVVRLLDAGGAAVADADGHPRSSAAVAAAGDGGEKGVATFRLGDLDPGTYRLAFDADARFIAPVLGPVTLSAGQEADLGELTFAVASTGSGVLHGSVKLLDEAGAPTRGTPEVRVDRVTAAGLQLVAQGTPGADGAFRFESLPPGVYAVRSTAAGFTPDLRAGLRVENAAANASPLAEELALVMHPVTAVLIPDLQRESGRYHTSARTVPVQVLAFGGMTRMRLASNPSFTSADGTELPFVDYAARAEVALPDVEGPLTVYAQFRKAAEGFEYTSDAFTTTVVRDATPPAFVRLAPAGLAAASDGRYWVRESGATLAVAVEADDEHSAVAGVALVQRADNTAGAAADAVFVRVEAPGGLARLSQPVALAAGEGKRVIWAFFKDRAGNIAGPHALEMGVDAQAPESAITINGGAAYATSRTVWLDVSATDALSGVARMAVADDSLDCETATYAPVTTVRAWTLPDLDGRATIAMCLRDVAGNSAGASASIVLDRRPPAISLVLANGATSTLTPNISVAIEASDAITSAADLRMQLTEDPSFATASWETGTGTRNITLSAGDGTKTLYLRVRDAAGNVSVASASILLDTTDPVPGVVQLSPAPWVAGTTAELRLSASGADTVRVTGDIVTAGGKAPDTALPMASVLPVVLTGDDGPKTVTVVFADRAGRTSAPVEARTTLDTKAPTGSLRILGFIDGGATSTARTGTRQVQLSVTASDSGSGVQAMRLADEPELLAAAPWRPFSDQSSWLLSPGDGNKTVYLQLVDAAGKESPVNPAISASTLLDTTPPSAPILGGAPAATRLAEVAVALATPSADTLSPPVRYEWITPALADWATVEFPAQAPLAANLPNRIRVRAVDAAGNYSTEMILDVLQDGKAPPAPVVLTPRAWVDATTTSASLSGAEADASFDHYEACTATVEAGADCPATCAFKPQSAGMVVSLAADRQTCLLAQAVDQAGNRSETTTVSVLSDLQRPIPPTLVPQINPLDYSVHAAAVQVFVETQAWDLPLGGADKPNRGIAYLEADDGTGFTPVCPQSVRDGAWEPCHPAARCTDRRLRCRGSAVAGLMLPLRENFRNTLAVRAVDLAGNTGDGASVMIDNDGPSVLAAEPGFATVPRIFRGTLAYGLGNPARVLELGANRRVDADEKPCPLAWGAAYKPVPGPQGVVFQAFGSGLNLAKPGSDGRFCTGDEPGPVAITGQTAAVLDLLWVGSRIVWSEYRTTDWSVGVHVLDAGEDGLFGTGDDKTSALDTTLEPSGSGTPGLSAGADTILVRTAVAKNEWTLFADTEATLAAVDAVLSADGLRLLSVPPVQTGGEKLELRAAGPDGRLGTADDTLATRALGSRRQNGHWLAVDGSRAVAIEIPQGAAERSNLWVWDAGPDGVFQNDTADDDDVVRALYPTTERRASPQLSAGLLVYAQSGTVRALDLGEHRWDVVPTLNAEAPVLDGRGTLFYGLYETGVLRARATDGHETELAASGYLHTPWQNPQLGYTADGDDLLVATADSATARRAGPDGRWFTGDDLTAVVHRAAEAQNGAVATVASGGGKALLMVRDGGATRPVVLEPGTSWLDGRAVDVLGELPPTTYFQGAGVSRDHAVWIDRNSGYRVAFRDAGDDRTFGTADDPPADLLPCVPGSSCTTWSMALSGDFLSFTGPDEPFLYVLDAGPDHRFKTGDDRPSRIALPTKGMCAGGICFMSAGGHYVSFIGTDERGGDQAWLADVRSGALYQASSHTSSKAWTFTQPTGRTFWLDMLASTSVFVFAP